MNLLIIVQSAIFIVFILMSLRTVFIIEKAIRVINQLIKNTNDLIRTGNENLDIQDENWLALEKALDVAAHDHQQIKTRLTASHKRELEDLKVEKKHAKSK